MGTPTQAFVRNEAPLLLTERQAADVLGLPVKAFTELAETGQLPGRDVAGNTRWMRADLDAFVNSISKSKKRSSHAAAGA